VNDFHPLKGIKVLDFSHVVAGPLCTFYLQQLGAEVVKVENRHGGDVMRRGKSLLSFVALNAGKHCIALDLQDRQDRDQAIHLALQSDVVVDNLRPGALARRGLGEATLRAANPRLVVCSISGYGERGPWKDRPAYDHVIQAATGMTLLAGEEGDAPIKTGFPVVDAATGILAAFGIVSALRERDRTGHGCFIDASMTAAAMQLMYPLACTALTEGAAPPRMGNRGFSGSPAADLFQTADGWVAMGANTPRQLLALLALLGREDIATDATIFPERPDPEAPAGFLRAAEPERLRAELAASIRDWRAAELEERCASAGVPCARVRTIAEFTTEAVRHDALATLALDGFGGQAVSPGLGFRVR
jgi:crotonobetainyl-CoA:carnitine CoA-transferase CaiB-like acyl-CoA transferase